MGAGGLVRAYTAAAAGAIKEAGIAFYREQIVFDVVLQYPDYQRISAELAKLDIRVKDTVFSNEVLLSLSVPVAAYQCSSIDR